MKAATKKNNSKTNQYLIITPAVAIDRSFDPAFHIDSEDSPANNNNNRDFSESRTEMTASRFMSRRPTLTSWRWCSFFCSAIKCFGNNSNGFARAAVATPTANYTTATSLHPPTNLNHFRDSIVTQQAHDRNQNIIYEL